MLFELFHIMPELGVLNLVFEGLLVKHGGHLGHLLLIYQFGYALLVFHVFLS